MESKATASPVDPPRSRRLVKMAVGLAAALLGLSIVATGGCMERLFYVPQRGPTPVPPGFAGAEQVYFASRDGTRLAGWFIPAAGVAGDTAAAPTVLQVHGNAGNMTSHLWFTEHLPPAGFNLFLFDYRGYGESDGAAHRRDDLLDDTHAALDTVLAHPGVDPERVGLFGQSLGGAIGLNLMADRDELRCAVIVAAFTSWREIAASTVSPGSSPGPVASFIAQVLIPDHARPVDAIASIERPMLVVHGGQDGTIPLEHGRRLAEAAPRAEFVILQRGDHNDLRAVHPELDGLVEEFYREHLNE